MSANNSTRTEKPCKQCGIIKSIDEYFKAPRMRDGHANKCKVCVTKRQKERYTPRPRKTHWFDLAGQRLGRWTVIRFLGRIKDRSIWECRCDCGKIGNIEQYSLRKGLSTSCGCYLAELLPNINRSHGLCADGNPLIFRWHAMMDRCFDPEAKQFHNYGGRGITVCDRWKNDPRAFAEDVGPPPTKRHSLDRIDNDGDYEPGNVRWATSHQQSRNMRRNRMISIDGRTMCLADWCKEFGIAADVVCRRVGRGMDYESALRKRTTRRRTL